MGFIIGETTVSLRDSGELSPLSINCQEAVVRMRMLDGYLVCNATEYSCVISNNYRMTFRVMMVKIVLRYFFWASHRAALDHARLD